MVDEGLLNGVQLLHRSQTFERRDALVRSGGGGRDAGANRLVAEVDGAGPTLRKTATEARPVQVELVPQDVQERRVGRRLDRMAPAVHGNDQPWHVPASRGGGPQSQSPNKPSPRRERGPGSMRH